MHMNRPQNKEKITKVIVAGKYIGLIHLSSETMIASLKDVLVQSTVGILG